MSEKTLSERMLRPVKIFLARRVRDCRSTVPILGEMLDRKLPLRERISVRVHLFTCKACTRYLEQITFLRDAMRRHSETLEQFAETLPDQLRPEIKERLKEIVRARVEAAQK